MASSTSIVNTMYCLAKVDGKIQVCRFSQDNIIFQNEAGEIVRVCKKKDKTHWKYFSESEELVGRFNHKLGDKVIVYDDKGRPKQFFIVDSGPADNEGRVKYIVAR